MTPVDFVVAVRRNVLAAAVEATTTILERPPGRKPKQELIEASVWYHSLSEHDRTMLLRVLRMTAHQTVFGFLSVLDGARVVEDEPQKGDFRLMFQKGAQEYTLTGSTETPLHEILNQQEGE
jgi:hypothetical protein